MISIHTYIVAFFLFFHSVASAHLYNNDVMILEQTDIVKTIMEPYYPGVSGESPLHHCARIGNHQICKDLVQGGHELEVTDAHGQTPFLTAMLYGNFDTALFFVKQGAEVNAVDKYQRNALHYVILFHHHRLIQWLVEAGVHINHQDFRGWTPLFLAAAKCKDSDILTLLLNGADPDQQEAITSMTPLMLASWVGKPFIVHSLLNFGSNALLVDIHGNQALHFAADQTNSFVVDQYQGYRYSLEHKNHNGETPSDIAERRQDEAVLSAVQSL